jgi:hypothetical protein
MATETRLVCRCCFCQRIVGEKNGEGQEGETGTYCPECWDEHFSHLGPYPEEETGD